MSSNLSVRNTFGITNPLTKQRYDDILNSHLELRRLLLEEWLIDKKIAESKDRKKEYVVLLDFATQRKLLQNGIIDVLVSFQRRTTGNFAVVRLWNSAKTKRQFTIEDKEELADHV